jgi:hypothetical protein
MHVYVIHAPPGSGPSARYTLVIPIFHQKDEDQRPQCDRDQRDYEQISQEPILQPAKRQNDSLTIALF